MLHINSVRKIFPFSLQNNFHSTQPYFFIGCYVWHGLWPLSPILTDPLSKKLTWTIPCLYIISNQLSCIGPVWSKDYIKWQKRGSMWKKVMWVWVSCRGKELCAELGYKSLIYPGPFKVLAYRINVYPNVQYYQDAFLILQVVNRRPSNQSWTCLYFSSGINCQRGSVMQCRISSQGHWRLVNRKRICNIHLAFYFCSRSYFVCLTSHAMLISFICLYPIE